MNEQAIVEKMITFIEKKERELQANKMNAEMLWEQIPPKHLCLPFV